MKVFIDTLGCQMNRLDSELVAAALRRDGHELLAARDGADAVLYNTCSVRKHAEQKVLSRLGVDARQRAEGRRLIVGVMGCMAQRLGEKLRRANRPVDILCGPGQLHALPEMLAAAAAGRPATALDPPRTQPPDQAAEAAMDRLDAGRDPHAGESSAQAFIRVARGCDNFCTYCIVPYVRGPERSRDPRAIVEEARRLAGAGRGEITLIGQTVNRYTWTAGERTVRFSALLARVSAVAGVRRLRFVTSHPLDFTDDILHAMRDLPNVVEYIHCPAQSGSDRMLKAMNRKYTRAAYDELLARAREIVPEVVLAGDFIVGFPGETEEDHAASAELIRRARYKNCFVFKYSPRPGTAAAKTLTDNVPDAVKRRRNNELLAVQQEAGLTHHRAYIGRTLEVLVEGPSPQTRKPAAAHFGRPQLVGRSRWDHVVIFDGPAQLAGQYVDVEITGAASVTLFAVLRGNDESLNRPE